MTRSSVIVKVNVRNCMNVRSPRSESPTCFLRVEHGAGVLGESDRVVCHCGEGEGGGGGGEGGGGEGGGGGVMTGGVEGTISCDPSLRESVDKLIQNPLIVTLLEVLPKEKKAKEEKTAVLGHVTIDLLPLITGESGILVRSVMVGGGEGEGEGGGGGSQVEVEVKASRDILTKEQIDNSNILFLRVRSLHSLPDSWSHAHQSPGSTHFTLSTHHPVPAGPPLSLPGGVVKGVESEEDHTQWKWPGGKGDGNKSRKWSIEDETGEVKGQEDISFRRTVECDQSRVDWNTELRTWLPPSSPSSLISTLSLSPLWPLEIVKCTTTQQTGKGKAKEEEPVMSHHGVAYLNLSPLLYPGYTTIAGAHTLHPFSNDDITSKIKREYRGILSPQLSSTSLPTGKKTGGGKPSKRIDSAQKTRTTTITTSQTSLIDQEQEVTSSPPRDHTSSLEHQKEGVVYEEARSYLWVELELMKPLVPRQSSTLLAQRVSEYIPPRPAVPKKEGGAEKAVREFHQTTSTLASSILNEYREMFGWGGAGGVANMTERKQQLMEQLCSTGKYHSYQEFLKNAVVGVVRERYGNQTGFTDPAHCHAFLSTLYTYLSDQLHLTTDQTISLDEPQQTTPTPVDFDLLKRFAKEAEDLLDYTLAQYYYEERVAAAGHVAQYWYDYGVFSLLIGRSDKAEECLKESISLNQQHIPALLLYGMINSNNERYDQGSEFMELATTSDPSNIIAWCMRGLLYEQQGERLFEEMCYGEAVRVWRGKKEKTFLTRAPVRESQGQMMTGGGKNVDSTTKEVEEERVEAGGGGGEGEGEGEGGGGGGEGEGEGKDGGERGEGEGGREGEDGGERGEDGGEVANVLSTAGTEEPTTDTEIEKTSPGVKVQNKAPPTPEPAVNEEKKKEDPVAAVFFQTAAFLLDAHGVKFAEMCLAHVLSSSSPPPSLYHILTAQLHLYRQQYIEAKESLSSALQIDIQSSWAWSLLGHTHFRLEEWSEAEQAYERCLLLKSPPPNQHSVLLHLGHIHLLQNRFSEAKEVYLRASRDNPSGVTWRGVGVACYKMGDVREAETALNEANILNNSDPLTWAYLSLVSIKTQRLTDAEQALKFAVKTGLKGGEEVVQEIQQEMTSYSKEDHTHKHISFLLAQLTV